MRIGLIGGLTRSEVQLTKIAADAGHKLESHNGEMNGRWARELRGIIERSEFVIILTTINSHQAVWIAKQAVREFRRPNIVLRKCGQDTFRELLHLLDPGVEQPIETAVIRGNGRNVNARLTYLEHAGLSGDPEGGESTRSGN